MTGVPVGGLLTVAALAVLLAAVLGAGEAAVLRLGRSALAELGSTQRPAARRVRRLMGDPHRVATSAAWVRVLLEALAATALVLVLAGTALTWWQTLLVAWPVVAVVGLVLVRSVPRGLARRHPQAALLLASGPLLVARGLASPARALARSGADQPELTDDEVREMVERVSESEHIEDEEREMFRSVLELGDTLTRTVMVPRTEMITLPAGTPLRKALSLFLRSGYSRVPVVGESVDDVVGVVYLKDVVRRLHAEPGAEAEPVDDVVRAAAFVPESKPVDELLRQMQAGASHIALVVDEFGGIAGLVTIEDALEEIVGELTDEHDPAAPEVEDVGDGSLRVPSRMPVDELGELFGLDLEDDDVDTAGGLLAKALGKVPLVGSSAEVDGLVLTADRVEGRRRRLATILVRPVGPDRPATADGRRPSRPEAGEQDPGTAPGTTEGAQQ